MDNFLEAIKQNIRNRENAIRREAFIEEFGKVLESDPTLEDLFGVLDQAHSEGLLNGARLSTFRFRQNAKEAGEPPVRITEEEKQRGIKTIALILSEAKKPLTKSEVVVQIEDERLRGKWNSLIGGLKREGLVEDNGEERNKKGYSLTGKGVMWLAQLS